MKRGLKYTPPEMDNPYKDIVNTLKAECENGLMLAKSEEERRKFAIQLKMCHTILKQFKFYDNTKKPSSKRTSRQFMNREANTNTDPQLIK